MKARMWVLSLMLMIASSATASTVYTDCWRVDFTFTGGPAGKQARNFTGSVFFDSLCTLGTGIQKYNIQKDNDLFLGMTLLNSKGKQLRLDSAVAPTIRFKNDQFKGLNVLFYSGGSKYQLKYKYAMFGGKNQFLVNYDAARFLAASPTAGAEALAVAQVPVPAALPAGLILLATMSIRRRPVMAVA